MSSIALNGDHKDDLIASLQSQVSQLQGALASIQDKSKTYYSSSLAVSGPNLYDDDSSIPQNGIGAEYAQEIIVENQQLDFKPRLNTSSYVNVVSEPQEREVALLGLEINLADASVYPASVRLHDKTVNMIAKMWNAPPPENGSHDYCGAGTVGSTEACLLAGLAHKFRWRHWYSKQKGLTMEEVTCIKPNIVISTCYQAAWEKFFRYFDVDPNFVTPNLLERQSAIDAKQIAGAVDEKTIAVVGILGNHYNGVYDPIWEINDEVQKINDANGWQVGIHVDAASGGFIAPFQEAAGCKVPPFDFRLPNVLSMSVSGHKFGESVCGTGWVVFRQRRDLAEHIAVSVTYLGGHCDSMTLNFSRPATGPYVQYYKLLRHGKDGYTSKVINQMKVAAYMRDFISDLKHPSGKPRFQMLDGGSHNCQCLPVVAGRMNPELNLHYDDIDMQHALAESHWYVSGYTLGFEMFFGNEAKVVPLFTDVKADSTMFRIVVKSNLTMALAYNLMNQIKDVLPILDGMDDGYHNFKTKKNALKRDAESASLADVSSKLQRKRLRRGSIGKSVC